MMNVRAFGLLLSSLAAVMFLSPEPTLRRANNEIIVVVEAAKPISSAKKATEDVVQTASGTAQRAGEEIRHIGSKAYDKLRAEKDEEQARAQGLKEKLKEAAKYQPNLGQGVGYYDQAYGISGGDHGSYHGSHSVEDYLEGARSSAKDAWEQANEGLGLLRREHGDVPETVESARNNIGEYYDKTKDAVVHAVVKKERELGTSLDHAKNAVENYYDRAKEIALTSVEHQKDTLEQYLDMVVHKLNAGREAVLHYAVNSVDRGKEAVAHGRDAVVDHVHRGKEAVVDHLHRGRDAMVDQVHRSRDAVADHVHRGKDAVIDHAYRGKDAVADQVYRGKDAVVDHAYRSKDAVIDYAADSVNQGRDALNRGKDTMVNYAAESVNHGKDALNRGKDTVVDYATDSINQGKDAVNYGRDAVLRKVNHGKDTVVQGKDRGVRKVQELEEEAARWGSSARGKVNETIKRWAHGTMDKLTETEELAMNICRHWIQKSVMSVVRLLHLFVFSSVYGSALWVTFISGYALSRSITRQQFGVVQSKIFPVYFRVLAAGLAFLLATHMILHPFPSADLSERLQYINLAVCFGFTLMNTFVLEPQSTKLMFEKLRLEKDEGKTMDGIQSPPADERSRQQMDSTSTKLRHFHGLSYAANLAVLAGSTWHLWYLNCRLVI